MVTIILVSEWTTNIVSVTISFLKEHARCGALVLDIGKESRKRK